ncbi:RAQPRD family integrative conjugative element protein [Halomonas dongshanensis]|uniref:RAQPRD family integrative conjugative element protein n=1 Tax=Halomonas dongshanensis TaxID=2890835 RepID=A0ABT2EHK1_9GAMM|nr:RAQPRD family integrative conjugative element protein [Halomonas dongshanensis]MCS2611046.1 RAQPRD family integrative conjugative element protein [Halomonas dongshanensis]
MTVRQRSPLTSLLTGLLLAGSLASPTHANDIDEIQRRDLALIQTQIEQIKIVVDRIDARQQNADPESTRVYFDIPRLRDDLHSITSGIDAYLAPDRLLPRQLRVLGGDYLDDRGQ